MYKKGGLLEERMLNKKRPDERQTLRKGFQRRWKMRKKKYYKYHEKNP